MTAIWFIFALMTGLAVLALLWPMSRRPALAGLPEGEARIATETGFYRDQLREIDRDAARGLLAAPEAEAARAEAARRLLRASREPGRTAGAMGDRPCAGAGRPPPSPFSTVPLVALLVYGIYGSPDLPPSPRPSAWPMPRRPATTSRRPWRRSRPTSPRRRRTAAAGR